eukprot:ctg_948.g335
MSAAPRKTNGAPFDFPTQRETRADAGHVAQMHTAARLRDRNPGNAKDDHEEANRALRVACRGGGTVARRHEELAPDGWVVTPHTHCRAQFIPRKPAVDTSLFKRDGLMCPFTRTHAHFSPPLSLQPPTRPTARHRAGVRARCASSLSAVPENTCRTRETTVAAPVGPNRSSAVHGGPFRSCGHASLHSGRPRWSRKPDRSPTHLLMAETRP